MLRGISKLRKFTLTLAAGCLVSSALFASPVDLNLFQSDFNTLMNGIARDVAPSLRLGALSGDIQADATINRFTISVLGVGVNATNGLGRVLAPGAAKWDFVLPLATLVNDNVGGNTFFERLMVYPALKTGIGFGWNTWDVSLSGIYFPQALVNLAVDLAEPANGKLHKLQPKFSFGNVGLEVRKTLIPDSGFLSLVPALSLGLGYHFTFFDMGVHLQTLADLGISAPSVGTNQTMDMTGDFSVLTNAHVVTVDFHASKHLLIFTPYLKLSGAYQNSTFTGKANLLATVTDSINSNNNTQQNISAQPVVNVSDFGYLVTTGLDINLFLFNLNVNVVGDLSRVLLQVHNLGLNGIDANAFSLNTGLRVAF